MAIVNIPRQIIAGDFLQFNASTESDQIINNGEYSLFIELTNASELHKLTGDAVTDKKYQWRFKVSSKMTKSFAAGSYGAVAFVSWTDNDTKEVERKTVWRGSTEILSSDDTRSHARKVLDALNKVIEGKATSDVIGISVEGKQITKMLPSELLKWRNYYQSLADSERIGSETRSSIRIKLN